MRNKGAIRFLAIALALVSLYQLSFTWITYQVREDAKEYAKGDIKKEATYLDSISNTGVYNFLWLRNYTFRECQEREINLGLDLKGGMNVTLEVSVVDLIRSLSNYSKDPTFLKAIEMSIEKQKSSQTDFVTLFGESFKEIAPNAKLASIFNTIELKDRINYNSTNDEVLEIIRNETKEAISNSFNILRSRIDRFGVSQPNIQKLEGNSGRILVELPGIKDPERVRKLLQGTANLEFWETYDNREIFEFLRTANDKIREMESDTKELKKDTTLIIKDTTLIVKDSTKTVKDSSNVNLITDNTKDSSNVLVKEINKDTSKTELVDNSLEEFNKQNPLFSVLKPSTTNDGKLMAGATVGTSHYRDTAKVNRYLKLKQVKSILPRDLKLLWEVKPIDYKKDEVPLEYFETQYQLIAIKVTNRDGLPALGGEVITDARAEFAQNQASSEVSMAMDSEGAKIWARITKENVGRQVAIVLDNYVYSAPNVNGEIKGGRSSITGNFTIAEAKDLANILKSGKLPAPAIIIEEEIVGPSLGQEAIDSGLISFVLAFIVILIYMIFYYKTAGIVADSALIANLFFIFGVLASLGATLTLPGIAGIVLTIGMSVDANVLIYERIREELKLGKGLKLAISDGYKHAYSAIIDANVTTLLTSVVLYVFGHGPIKGFATTLFIGIVTSLFSAIFITRLVFIFFLDKNINVSFATKFTEDAFKNMKIKFIEKRKIFYVISGVVIVLGIGSLIFRGLNQGVDFKGGRSYTVRFKQEVKTQDIADKLKVVYGESPEVKTFGQSNQVKITTKYLIDLKETNTDSIVETKLYEGLLPLIGADVSIDKFLSDYKMSSQTVGPTIADDIKIAAVWSIIFSLIIMFLYIFMRFKNWQFGVGAIVALTHDVLFVLGLFSLLYGVMPFSMEIGQAFIAAILTVIGYSLNDTVVVFDRIREYLNDFRKKDKIEVYNSALNSTISRTFSTSLSTFFVLLAIFIFGGEVIRGFTFALLVGVVVGTYSSLFIATPVVFDTIKKTETVVKKGSNREYKGGKKKDKNKKKES